MDKYGAKSAGYGKAGTVRKLDCQDYGVPRQRHDGPRVVPGKQSFYYYWQRRLYDTLLQQQAVQPTFAEITPSSVNRQDSSIAVTVRISGAEADIHTGADAATVETVLRILKSC